MSYWSTIVQMNPYEIKVSAVSTSVRLQGSSYLKPPCDRLGHVTPSFIFSFSNVFLQKHPVHLQLLLIQLLQFNFKF